MVKVIFFLWPERKIDGGKGYALWGMQKKLSGYAFQDGTKFVGGMHLHTPFGYWIFGHPLQIVLQLISSLFTVGVHDGMMS